MNSIEQIKSGLTIGHFGLGMRGDHHGTPPEVTHDGDTISVSALGNFPVRFLAIDTPEVSFALPSDPEKFISTNKPEWEAFLSDPFAAQYGPLRISPELKANLKGRLGPGAASNHFQYAKKAERALEAEITADRDAMGWTNETFKFFLAFAHEVTDRYGRLLAYINREDQDAQRPMDYNTRQLRKALACPYGIWPNVGSSACYAESITALVLDPFKANEWASRDKYIKASREAIATARKNHTGIFDKDDPLRIEPFELRFLAQRRPPERWVIDLSKSADVLIAPQKYFTVKMEDRLFIPEEYVPLFETRGWKKEKVTKTMAA